MKHRKAPAGPPISLRPKLLVGQHPSVAAHRKCPQPPWATHSPNMQHPTKLHTGEIRTADHRELTPTHHSAKCIQVNHCRAHWLSVSLTCFPALVLSNPSIFQRELQLSLPSFLRKSSLRQWHPSNHLVRLVLILVALDESWEVPRSLLVRAFPYASAITQFIV